MDAFSDQKWREYYDAMRGLPPRETLVNALDRFDAEVKNEPRLAVDIGCGEGRDTVEMLRRGWTVFAFDGQSEAIDRLQARSDLPENASLTTRVQHYENATWPQANLINASYSLPFCAPDYFPHLWAQVLQSLLPGGRFSGQFFGDRDGWAGKESMNHHTRAEVESLLASLEVEYFVEEERDGTTANGQPKHWHIFHVVTRTKVLFPGIFHYRTVSRRLTPWHS